MSLSFACMCQGVLPACGAWLQPEAASTRLFYNAFAHCATDPLTPCLYACRLFAASLVPACCRTPAVRLIQLPLPSTGAPGAPGSALPDDPLEVAAAAAGVGPEHVSALTQQGLSRADALAAC